MHASGGSGPAPPAGRGSRPPAQPPLAQRRFNLLQRQQQPGHPQQQQAPPPSLSELLGRAKELAYKLRGLRHYEPPPRRPPGSATRAAAANDEYGGGTTMAGTNEAEADPDAVYAGAEGGPAADSSVRALNRGRNGDTGGSGSSGGVRCSADAADDLVRALREVLAALRAATAPRPPPAHGAPPPAPPVQLSPAEEREVYNVGVCVWNHGLEAATLEQLRHGGAATAARISGGGDRDGKGADPDGGGGLDGAAAAAAAAAAAWRVRVLTHIAWCRHLAAEAVALLPPPRQPLAAAAAARNGRPAAATAAAAQALERSRLRLTFCLAAGRTWLRLRQLESAELCLSRAMSVLPLLLSAATAVTGGGGGGGRADAAAAAAGGGLLGPAEAEELLLGVFEAQVTRTQVLWRLGQTAMAAQALSECSALARDAQAARPDISCLMSGWLAQVLLDQAIATATGRQHTAAGPGGATAAGSDAALGLGPGPSRRRFGLHGGPGGGGVAASLQASCAVLDDEDAYDMYADVYGEDQAAGGQPGGTEMSSAALVEPAEAIPLLDQLYELVTHAVQCHQASCAALEAAAGGWGEAEAEAVAQREEALVDLRDQVLAWLALCHLGAGDPGAALACAGALREAGSGLAEDAQLAAVEARAHAASGDGAAAVRALTALAGRPDASPGLVWECLDAALEQPRLAAAPEALWPVAAALQARLPRDASPCLEFLRAVYDLRSGGAGGAATDATARGAPGALAAADRLTLAILAAPTPDRATAATPAPAAATAAATPASAASGGEARAEGAAAPEGEGVPAAVRWLQGQDWRRLRERRAAAVAGGTADEGSAVKGEGEAGEGEEGEEGAMALAREQRAAARALLWNRGVALFDDAAFAPALRFFAAAAAFAGNGPEEAAAHQSAALCCMGLHRSDAALAAVGRAEAAALEGAAEDGGGAGPPTVPPAIVFLRFKVLLTAGDAAAAAAMAPAVAAAEACSPGLLAVACSEASAARAFPAARLLLGSMLEAARRETDELAAAEAAGGGPRPRSTLPEAHLLRLLIRCLQDSAKGGQGGQGQEGGGGEGGRDRKGKAGGVGKRPQPEPQQQQQGPAAGEGGGAAGPYGSGGAGLYGELASYFTMAADRLDAVGPAAFFGAGAEAEEAGGAAAPAGQDRDQHSLEWFAWTAWNTGLAAGSAADACAAGFGVGAGAGPSAAGAAVAAGANPASSAGAEAVFGVGGAEAGGPLAGVAACAALMMAAGRLLGRLRRSARTLGCRRVAFSLAAAAALQVHTRPSTALHAPHGAGAAAAAAAAADAARLASAAIAAARGAAADVGAAAVAAGRAAPPADKCDVLVTATELRLLVALHAPPGAFRTALAAAAAAFPPGPGCLLPGSLLLSVGRTLRRWAADGPPAAAGAVDAAPAEGGGGVAGGGGAGGGDYGGVAVAAFQQALQLLTAAAAVDLEGVAEAVRSLLALAGGDDGARLAVLRELAGLLAGAGPGRDPALAVAAGLLAGGGGGGGGAAFPELEMEALVTGAWNRGAHHVKFGRLALALDHMRAALGLIRHAPALEAAHRGWMEEQAGRLAGRLAAAGAARGGGGGGAKAGVAEAGDDPLDGWRP